MHKNMNGQQQQHNQQQQQQQSSQIVGTKWFYCGPDNEKYGPYMSKDMLFWLQAGYFNNDLFVRTENEQQFRSLGEWRNLIGSHPFATSLYSFDASCKDLNIILPLGTPYNLSSPVRTKWIVWGPNNYEFGPFMSKTMALWLEAGYFQSDLLVRTECEQQFRTLKDWIEILGSHPFATHVTNYDDTKTLLKTNPTVMRLVPRGFEAIIFVDCPPFISMPQLQHMNDEMMGARAMRMPQNDWIRYSQQQQHHYLQQQQQQMHQIVHNGAPLPSVDEKKEEKKEKNADTAARRNQFKSLKKLVEQHKIPLDPSQNEKEFLMNETNLTYVQVNDYFKNQRKWFKKRTPAADWH